MRAMSSFSLVSFFTGFRVEETDLLEALATLALAAVGHHDVIERRVRGTAAGQTNCHHVNEPFNCL